MVVSGIVLAAGRSSRLNQPKQLLTLGGEPMVRIVVRNALASVLSEVILVTGAEAVQVAAAVGELGQRVVFNPNYAEGQSTSVLAGLDAIDPGSEAVLFLLGDQPEVGPDVIDTLVESFERSAARIAQPVYGGTPGNPVLFSRGLFSELQTLTGDTGARSIVRRRADDVERVVVRDGLPPGDVDTDEDYRRLLERWHSG